MQRSFGFGFVTGELAGRVVPLPQRGEVGRAPGAAVHMSERPVAQRHAELYLDRGTHHVIDLHSPGGTYVDGRRIPAGEPVRLEPGALVTFGEGGPLAVYDEVGALRRSGGAAVRLCRDDPPGGSWVLSGPAEVGRGSSCTIQLDPQRDSLASSRHVHLLPAFGRLVATDLGSANGTYWRDGARLVQSALGPGETLVLGGDGGPVFRVEWEGGSSAELSHSLSETSSSGGPPPIPSLFGFEVTASRVHARIDVAIKTEVSFGSFAGLNDFETVCFPRELENESDASDRSESIGPQHASLVLTDRGVDLRDEGYARTKLDGRWLRPQSRVALPARFVLALGEDALTLRGKLLVTPSLPPVKPRTGHEAAHPVECVVLERAGDGPHSRLFVQLVRQATIGSGDEAAIQLDAVGVESLHALLYVVEDVLYVTPVGNAPVAVSGVRVEPGTGMPVGIGAELYMGTVVLRAFSQE
ncbi:MAG: FHA domain-containing protein [Planctomycetota bacterium]